MVQLRTLLSITLSCWLLLLPCALGSTRQPGATLIDVSGNLRPLPASAKTKNEGRPVAIIASPNTPSFLVQEAADSQQLVSLSNLSDDHHDIIICRGATLSGTSAQERQALGAVSLMSGAIVVDGITAGDAENGCLRNSRHARTLTALFRPRLRHEQNKQLAATEGKDVVDTEGNEKLPATQTLFLSVQAKEGEFDREGLINDVLELYKAAAMEVTQAPEFETIYKLEIVSVQSKADEIKIMEEAASATWDSIAPSSSVLPLKDVVSLAYKKVSSMSLSEVGLDTPLVAHAFVAVGNAFSKHSRTVRATLASWNGRTARGLIVDGFGAKATTLLQGRVLDAFDAETMAASGLPTAVAQYRAETRQQLVTLIESGIREAFAAQVTNLEKSTLRHLQRQLLKTAAFTGGPKSDPAPEAVMQASADALKKTSQMYETLMNTLQVPALGLVKDKYVREMSRKLNDELLTFPDSPQARLKRSQLAAAAVSKEKKKPTSRKPAVDVGLDFVAVLRPDGFGSLQGFAGYQLLPNSRVIFGINNDADDPAVLAQFGGVRPPLLKVQPQLKLDVEM